MQKKYILVTILYIVSYINSAQHQLAPIERIYQDILNEILKNLDQIGYQKLIEVNISPELVHSDSKSHNFPKHYSKNFLNLSLASKTIYKNVEHTFKTYSFYKMLTDPQGSINNALHCLHKENRVNLLLLKMRRQFADLPDPLDVSLEVWLQYCKNSSKSEYSLNFCLELSDPTVPIQQIKELKYKFGRERWDECFEMFLKDNLEKNELIWRWIKLFKDKFVFDRKTNPIDFSGDGCVDNKWRSILTFNEDCFLTVSLFCTFLQMRMLEL